MLTCFGWLFLMFVLFVYLCLLFGCVAAGLIVFLLFASCLFVGLCCLVVCFIWLLGNVVFMFVLLAVRLLLFGFVG